MKKILITGNSGYIGSHLSKLLEDDYIVHGLDIKDKKISVAKHYSLNINDLRYVNLNQEYDTVIHLAALVNVGESERIPTEYYLNNVFGTMNVLGRLKFKNFIFASTGAAEGCMSAYGISKRAAEDIVAEQCKLNDASYTIFRFYNVIGSTVVPPTNPDGLMYNLIKAKDTGSFKIFGNDYSESIDGTCVRDYVHVNEICNALRKAIEDPSNSIESLGHGVGHTVKQMVDIFKRVNNCDFEVIYGDRRKGDLPVSVLQNVSRYMDNLYTIEELLKVDNISVSNV